MTYLDPASVFQCPFPQWHPTKGLVLDATIVRHGLVQIWLLFQSVETCMVQTGRGSSML
jgi:hypothetical protein